MLSGYSEFGKNNLLKKIPMVLTIVALKGIVKPSFSCGPDFHGTKRSRPGLWGAI